MENKTQIQNNIISELPNTLHGILLIAMRVGKTRITIEQLKKENPDKILWVTPSPKLRDIEIPNEFKKWEAEYLLERTEIITYNALSKKKGKYKIILDECQDLTVLNSKTLINGELAGDIIALTGELPKHKEKLNIYKKLNLEVIKEITIEEAIELGLISDYRVFVIDTKLSEIKDLKVNTKSISFVTSEKDNYNYLNKQVEKEDIKDVVEYNFAEGKIKVFKKEYTLKPFVPKFECDQSYLIMNDKPTSIGYIAIKNSEVFGKKGDSHPNYMIKNKDLVFRPTQFSLLNRMKFIYNSTSKLNTAKQLIPNLKGRIISFSGSIDHSISVSENNFHSKTDKTYLNKFNNKEIDLLSCVNSGGIGFTFDEISNIVIIQANSNKKGSISQKIARGLLLNTTPTITNIFIIQLEDTIDVKWVNSTLESFDRNKIINCTNVEEALIKYKELC